MGNYNDTPWYKLTDDGYVKMDMSDMRQVRDYVEGMDATEDAFTKLEETMPDASDELKAEVEKVLMAGWFGNALSNVDSYYDIYWELIGNCISYCIERLRWTKV